MKKASGSVRIDLAQAREMESFTQFSSDLDDATKTQLKYGSCLTELLKQPLGHPLSMHEQVITLCVATHKTVSYTHLKIDFITYPDIAQEAAGCLKEKELIRLFIKKEKKFIALMQLD